MMTFDDAAVHERRTGTRVEIKARGDLQAVLNVVKYIFERFDPRGYGTTAEIQFDAGAYVANIKRASSCD